MLLSLLTENPKCGTFAEQRAVIADEIGVADREYGPGEVDEVVLRATRKGDTLALANARALGSTSNLRDARLAEMAGKRVKIALPGVPAKVYHTAEDVAEFQMYAKRPTGRGTRRQKRNPGRPAKYPALTDVQKRKAAVWYHSQLSMEEVQELVKEEVGKSISRRKLWEIFGPRGGGRRDKPKDAKK